MTQGGDGHRVNRELVIEDAETIRAALESGLTGAGHTVLMRSGPLTTGDQPLPADRMYLGVSRISPDQIPFTIHHHED